MSNGFLAIRSITLQDPFLDFYEDTKEVKLVLQKELYEKDQDVVDIKCGTKRTYIEHVSYILVTGYVLIVSTN